MLKYGNILQISTGNSKTLYPRDLAYAKAANGTITNVQGSSNANQSSANFDSAAITDLTTNSINFIPNTLAKSIVISSPVAFSLLKADYETNNFNIYPIFFSQDIFINNKNFVLQSNNVSIKDNVL